MAEDQRKPEEITEAVETQQEETPQASAPEQTEETEGMVARVAEMAQEAVGAATGAVGSVLERAVEAVAERLDFSAVEEGGDSSSKDITSFDSIEALRSKRTTTGYTGEIIGRVVKLADLVESEDEGRTPGAYDQFRALVDQTLTEVTENEIIRGRIVSVGEKDVVIDIGFKSDGIVPKNEFDRELSPGDEVEVFLERIEDYHGQLVLSKTKADQYQRWRRIEEAYEQEKVLEGTIVRRIKGGMIVELFDGVEAFLPGSQIDVRPVRDFDAYLDKKMEFKIVKLNPANENIVVSHKALIEKDLESQRRKILETMEPGQILEGIVKNITDFGVFIDLGGVDGLLHITDLSWGRVSHPSELVSLDDKLNVVVLDYDKDRQRISLGLKQLQSHPWENIGEKYTENLVVEGKVVSITDYGAFVELEKGIEGLVHISEMSWTEHVKHPSQMVALGQLVNVKILNIDEDGKKISLGMKQLEPDPWHGIAERYPAGTVLRGKVRNITNFGVFVEIEAGIDGLVHISDLSWTKKVRHPGEIVKKGQELDVVILNIDEKERRISLGHKQVETNPWNQFAQMYTEGSEVEGKIVRVQDNGVIVELPLEVEAYIPNGELKYPQDPAGNYREGDKLTELRVIKFDSQNKDIFLSETAKARDSERSERENADRERRVARDAERRSVRDFQEQTASSGPTTFGELSGLAALRQQMQDDERAVATGGASGQEEAPAAEAPAAEEEAAEPIKTAGSLSTSMENAPGAGNRVEGTAEQQDTTFERPEDAGDFQGAEHTKASQKSVSTTEGSELAGRAEEHTEDVTPSKGSGDKPVAVTETGQSVEEVKAFTEETGKKAVNKDAVTAPEKDAASEEDAAAEEDEEKKD
jgi:small subunit ribosomal protein S1